jgi:hypothetical protein
VADCTNAHHLIYVHSYQTCPPLTTCWLRAHSCRFYETSLTSSSVKYYICSSEVIASSVGVCSCLTCPCGMFQFLVNSDVYLVPSGSRLCNFDSREINEYGAVGAMRFGRATIVPRDNHNFEIAHQKCHNT